MSDFVQTATIAVVGSLIAIAVVNHKSPDCNITLQQDGSTQITHGTPQPSATPLAVMWGVDAKGKPNQNPEADEYFQRWAETVEQLGNLHRKCDRFLR